MRLSLSMLWLQQQRSLVKGVIETLKEAYEVMQVRMIDFPSAIYHHHDSTLNTVDYIVKQSHSKVKWGISVKHARLLSTRAKIRLCWILRRTTACNLRTSITTPLEK